MSELRKLLTVKEVAALLAMSTASVRQLIRHGELAYIQRGRGAVRKHLVFDPRDIEDYINRSKRRDSLPLIPAKADRDGPSLEIGFLARRAARLAERKARQTGSK